MLVIKKIQYTQYGTAKCFYCLIPQKFSNAKNLFITKQLVKSKYVGGKRKENGKM